MEIIYKSTEKEIEFLNALSTKEYPQNAYSGRSSDDAFIKTWDEIITVFRNAGLIEKKDSGDWGAYWSYGLNKKGLELQKQYVKNI